MMPRPRDCRRLRDWQHQVGPDEGNAQAPCPAVVLLEPQDGVVGLLGRGESRAGGEPDRESAEHEQAHLTPSSSLAWQRAGRLGFAR